VAIGADRRIAATADPAEEAASTGLQTNARGQTYGTALDKEDGSGPDLVRVVATNGEEGYCLRSDLDDSYNGLGRDATADEMNNAGLRSRTIPVYESDGTTRIDVFTCGGPGSQAVFGIANGVTVTMTACEDDAIVTTTRDAAGTITAHTLEALDGTVTVVK